MFVPRRRRQDDEASPWEAAEHLSAQGGEAAEVPALMRRFAP